MVSKKKIKLFHSFEDKHKRRNINILQSFNWRLIVFLMSLMINIPLESSIAAEIFYDSSEIAPSKYKHRIFICGDIKEGDYYKFTKIVQSLLKSGGIIYDLQLSSFGGDTVEAMKIGKKVRELGLRTRGGRVPIVDKNKNCPDACNSACFIIWAGGICRYGKIGVHRPRFSEDYFKKLSKDEADKKYNTMANEVYNYLIEMDIPTDIIEKMFATSSSNINYLEDQKDKDGNYFFEWAPSFEEWIAANCGRIDKGKARLWQLLKLFAESGDMPKLLKMNRSCTITM